MRNEEAKRIRAILRNCGWTTQQIDRLLRAAGLKSTVSGLRSQV
jgi:hypothetical protein